MKGDRERLFEAMHNLVEHGLFLCSPTARSRWRWAPSRAWPCSPSVTTGWGFPTRTWSASSTPSTAAAPAPGEQRGARAAPHRQDRPAPRRTGGGRQRAGAGHPPPRGAARPSPRQVGVAGIEDGVAPQAGHILLVEDDRDCREVLQELLEQEGYSVGLGRGRRGGPGAARGPPPGDGAPRPPPLRGGRPQRAPPPPRPARHRPRRRSTSSPAPPRWPP